jgi:serine/threonine protein kinase
MANVAEAVHHSHEESILLRGLKPSNIMVDADGQCWIIDFGLSGYVNGSGETQAPESNSGSDLTVNPMGTPQYMAPEQYLPDKNKIDARTDVWGLGATLYELLALRRAFEGSSKSEIRQKILSHDPTPLNAIVRNVPADLAAICQKALRKDPSKRYPSAQAFAEDLRRWLKMEPTIARPARTPRRVFLWTRRNKGWATAIGAMLISAVAFAGVLIAEENAKVNRLRESLIQKFNDSLRASHTAGWTEKSWAMVRDIADIRKDSSLRDAAAATFFGVDARQAKLFKSSATSVAFDTEGKRLLMGGLSDNHGHPTGRAKLWDEGNDQVTMSNQSGQGPVTFCRDGSPVQLAQTDKWSLTLWDMAKQQKLSEFTISKPEKNDLLAGIITAALSVDGSLVAASADLGNEKGILVLWDAITGKEMRRFDTKITAVEFSPDNALLATGDQNGEIVLRSLPRCDEIGRFQSQRLEKLCLAYGRKPR